MFGLMQVHPLLISSLIRHAAENHGPREIVSRLGDGTIRRTDHAAIERRARRLAQALQDLGIGRADRVGTLDITSPMGMPHAATRMATFP